MEEGPGGEQYVRLETDQPGRLILHWGVEGGQGYQVRSVSFRVYSSPMVMSISRGNNYFCTGAWMLGRATRCALSLLHCLGFDLPLWLFQIRKVSCVSKLMSSV